MSLHAPYLAKQSTNSFGVDPSSANTIRRKVCFHCIRFLCLTHPLVRRSRSNSLTSASAFKIWPSSSSPLCNSTRQKQENQRTAYWANVKYKWFVQHLLYKEK